MMDRQSLPRRKFMKAAGKGLGASFLLTVGFPTIVPSSVFGSGAPSRLINVGIIGSGHHHVDIAHWGMDTERFSSDSVIADTESVKSVAFFSVLLKGSG